MKLSDYDGNNEQARYSPGSFSVIEKEALYKAIFSRRDVRSHFTESKDVPNDVLRRILDAAHHAPSVGFSQPWNFIVIKNKPIRQQVKNSFLQEQKNRSPCLMRTQHKIKKKENM